MELTELAIIQIRTIQSLDSVRLVTNDHFHVNAVVLETQSLPPDHVPPGVQDPLDPRLLVFVQPPPDVVRLVSVVVERLLNTRHVEELMPCPSLVLATVRTITEFDQFIVFG